MKTLNKKIPDQKTSHLSELIKDPSRVLFFDIETTGLSPRGASIYLIGCAFFSDGSWYCRQYFADTPAEESLILSEFCAFAKSYTCFWNFNGTTFDIPFIQAKCKKHALSVFDPINNIDMYKLIRPFKNLLHLPGCRQKQLEEYIGLYRNDPFNGGQLIDLYRIYGESFDEALLEVLLLHNFEDIQGMLELAKIMAIPKVFQDHDFTVQTARIQSYTDAQGQPQKQLQLSLSLPCSLPVSIACNSAKQDMGCCFLSGREQKILLKIPVYSGELKYFYKDYKNYSYLPQEDQAIHKSVAIYVDKSRRMPATASNCYTRKTGDFIPCYKGAATDDIPVFWPAYKAKASYLLPEDSFLEDPTVLHTYAAAVLKTFL